MKFAEIALLGLGAYLILRPKEGLGSGGTSESPFSNGNPPPVVNIPKQNNDDTGSGAFDAKTMKVVQNKQTGSLGIEDYGRNMSYPLIVPVSNPNNGATGVHDYSKMMSYSTTPVASSLTPVAAAILNPQAQASTPKNSKYSNTKNYAPLAGGGYKQIGASNIRLNK